MATNDNGDNILKGEIPTEAEFARLLCDKTFVDYFNTFLSLPVFAQRLLYRFKEQTFELDPPLKATKYRLDRVKLMRWVRTLRAPLFFKTDLYLEYLLCKALQKTQLQLHSNVNDPTSAKDRILDQRLLSRWLGRASGMNRFRRFLTQTTGERSLAFWLDAERFRKAAKDDDEEHRQLFRQMEAKYFKYGASLELPEHSKWPPFSAGRESKPEPAPPIDAHQRQRRHSYFVGGGVEVETRLPGGSLFGNEQESHISQDSFIVIQGFILKTLQNYWVPRFIIHCKIKCYKDGNTVLTATPNIHDINAFSPNWYAVRVRSLSELAGKSSAKDDETAAADDTGKSAHVLGMLGVCKKLKKQSMSNLMGMFSSRGLRNSELNAMLKMEDTGEKVAGKTSGESYTDDWLLEEFPLATISEESLATSRHSSAATSLGVLTPSRSSSCSLSISPRAKSPDSRIKTPSSRQIMKASRSKMKSSATRVMSPLARVTSIAGVPDQPSTSDLSSTSSAFLARELEDLSLLDDHVAEEVTRRKSSVTAAHDASLKEDTNAVVATTQEEAVEAKSSLEKQPSVDDETGLRKLSVEGLPPEDDDKGRHTPSFFGARRRRSSMTPTSLANSSSNSSMTQGSHTSMSSLAGSRRRMSIAGGSTGVISTKSHKPKPPPPRRNRSQSVEFRLADFSMLMTTLDDSKDADKMLPQLEADLQALKAQQEADEKKKLEGPENKKKRRKKRSFNRSKADSRSKASAAGRKGRMARMQKGGRQGKGKFAKLTESNVAKFNAQTLGIVSPMLQPTTVYHAVIHPDATASSLGASLKKKQQEFEKKEYGKLSFQEKLEHDDFRLQTLPRISSPLPPAPPTGTRDVTLKSRSIASSKKTMSIDTRLPQIALKSITTTTSTSSTMGICKPSYRGYNLGEPNYRHRHRLLVGAVAADKLAAGPFEKHMVKNDRTMDVKYLRFWQAAQEYLTTAVYSCDIEGIFVRQRQCQNITATFLTLTGDRFIALGEGLTEELKKQLPLNSGDELLTHAQDLCCEAMREAWEAYQKHDRDEFLTRTTSRKPFGDLIARAKTKPHGIPTGILGQSGGAEDPSKSCNDKLQQALYNARQLVETKQQQQKPAEGSSISSQAPPPASHRVWKALHIAQCTSRLEPDSAELSDPSDPDSDSDDEGSLRKKSIVVVRKRRAKSQSDIIRSWTPSLEIQRIKHEREILAAPPKEKEAVQSEAQPKAVCKAIRKDGKTIFRPPRPKTFQEVLRDNGHFEFFKRFLTRERHEPLMFWQAVENMRTTCRDAKSRQSRTLMIIRKYFCKATDYGTTLECDADIILDIPNMEKVTPQMLLSAQACVARSMEERWFSIYQETFPEDTPSSDSVDEDGTKIHAKVVPREKNKSLWAMFISNVTSFRRGLMNQITLGLFSSYLGLEVAREIEKQKETGTQSKRLISNKIVLVDRLRNDLGFWVEVERFKDLADSAAAAAAAGTYTLEDEEYVQQKARAIIECYLDSQVPPKLQININQELADDIMDTAQNGLIERGLFHDAAVGIFCVLLYCWKKFCKERFAPPPPRESDISLTKPKKKKKRRKAPSTPLVCGVKIKTIVGQNVDDAPKMIFTLQHGIQLILPPKPPKPDEDAQRDHIKRVMRQLYPHVGDVFRNGDDRLIQLYHQLVAQHGQQGIQSLLQQRRFSTFKTLGSIAPPLAKHFNPHLPPNYIKD